MEMLNIRSQQPQIAIDVKHADFTVSTPPVKMDIQNGATTVEIHTTASSLSIDQYPSRASYGILSVTDRIAENAKQGEENAKKGTARRASETAEMLSTSQTNGLIAQQEKAKLHQMPTMKIQLCQVTLPSIHYTSSKVTFTTQVKPVSLKVDAQPVNTNYVKPAVDVYMKQKANVQMWVSQDNYDIYA